MNKLIWWILRENDARRRISDEESARDTTPYWLWQEENQLIIITTFWLQFLAYPIHFFPISWILFVIFVQILLRSGEFGYSRLALSETVSGWVFLND